MVTRQPVSTTIRVVLFFISCWLCMVVASVMVKKYFWPLLRVLHLMKLEKFGLNIFYMLFRCLMTISDDIHCPMFLFLHQVCMFLID
jgi:hypothetical protein